MISKCPTRRRRGVLLLVILGLLALFGMVAISFVLITSHHKRAAGIIEEMDRQDREPHEDITRCVRMMLRGSSNHRNPIAGHSLLEDMYGTASYPGLMRRDDSLEIRVTCAPGIEPVSRAGNVFSGDFLAITPPLIADGSAFTLTPEYLVGCPLTMLDGPGAGETVRIVAYREGKSKSGEPRGLWYLEGFDQVSPASIVRYLRFSTERRIRYLVNETPFGGYGAGYDLAVGNPNNPNLPDEIPSWLGRSFQTGIPDESGWEYALLPNSAAFWAARAFPATFPLDSAYADPSGPGGANEPYDAPDYQNMFFADILAEVRLSEPIGPTSGKAAHLPIGTVLSPTFHRPDLWRYWLQRRWQEVYASGSNTGPDLIDTWKLDATKLTDPLVFTGDAEHDALLPCGGTFGALDLRHKLSLRPLPDHHFVDLDGNGFYTPGEPYFTGSNPACDTTKNAYYTGFNPLWSPFRDIVVDGTTDNLLDPRSGSSSEELDSAPFGWDVDNAGDGILDSIWIDPGGPVRSTADGRRYKMLVAFLCIDMDGRLNLNAHGAPMHVSYALDQPTFASGFDAANGFRFIEKQGIPHETRGLGYAPYEISLGGLFDLASAPDEYHRLFFGGYERRAEPGQQPFDRLVRGRYGEANLFLRATTESVLPAPGVSGAGGMADGNDWQQRKKFRTVPNIDGTARQTFPNNYLTSVMEWQDTTVPRAYGTPLDLKGTLTVAGVDLRGQPMWRNLYSDPAGLDPVRVVMNGWDGMGTNDPGEIDLNQAASRVLPISKLSHGAVDAPFTPEELERLLRPFDSDTGMLPDRLTLLAPHAFGDGRQRLNVTVESRHVPSPSLVLPPHLKEKYTKLDARTGLIVPIRPIHMTEILRHAPKAHGIVGGELSLKNIRHLFAPELLAGLPMDLNRPIGNGLDDDENGLVDEPTERFVLQQAGELEMFAAGVPFDHDNDGWEFDWVANGDKCAAFTIEHNPKSPKHDIYCAYRQRYARHLYSLMMLMVDVEKLDVAHAPNFDFNRNLPAGAPKNAGVARAIAQWAVNVVDFYDRDSIMTPFEYDIHPFVEESAAGIKKREAFGTWDVDGDPKVEGHEKEFRGLVWGVERPEMLITETLATHAYAQEDLSVGEVIDPPSGSKAKPDDDLDQRKRPSPMLAIELWNCSSDQPPVNQPGDFATVAEGQSRDLCNPSNPGIWGIKLDRAVPPTKGNPNAPEDPVWRLVIVDGDDHSDPGEDSTKILRRIYFTEAKKTPDSAGETFGRPDGTEISVLKPNQFAVIAGGLGEAGSSSYETALSTEKVMEGVVSGAAPPPPPPSNAAIRKLVLGPADTNTGGCQISIKENGANMANQPPVDYLDPNRLPIAVPLIDITDKDRPLNISDPKGGYGKEKGWDPDKQEYDPPLDEPLDKKRTDAMADDIATIGTHKVFRIVHLQRLANPTMAHDKVSNPYLTVDTMPVDLTVYNGWENDEPTGPSSTGWKWLKGKNEHRFCTRERGDFMKQEGSALKEETENIPWRSEPLDDTHEFGEKTPPGNKETLQAFDPILRHSLGFLNQPFWSRKYEWGYEDFDKEFTSGATYWRWDSSIPKRYWGTSEKRVSPGADPKPVPWLTWNNRPFANPMELMLVPSRDSFGLLREFRVVLQPGNFGAGATGATERLKGRYPHLPDFLQTGYKPGVSGATSRVDWHRILGYVRVRSPFVGTETFANEISASLHPEHPFHPPYHWADRYREPGRLNLNTIASQTVWNGLMAGFPAFAGPTSYQNSFLFTSRLAKEPSATNYMEMNYPGIWSSPYLPVATTKLTPADPRTGDGTFVSVSERLGDEMNSTLLRKDLNTNRKIDDAKRVTGGTPLFEFSPPLGGGPVGETNNPIRNPFFRNQGMMRLANMTTTRSSVFAVWITVGYFECHKASDAQMQNYGYIYPDGWVLGDELGLEEGDIERHRAFYMIDRSIPVGFRRGEDLNSEKCIIHRRMIE